MAKWILSLAVAICCSGMIWAADGSWSKWSDWSPCSVTCGPGEVRRYRTCDNPPPRGGGKWCPGSLRETKPCGENDPCPVDGAWTEWTPWTDCSTTCGQGSRQRKRECSNPKPFLSGKPCKGAGQQQQNCKNLKECPRDGGWSAWSEESSCSVTCGVGTTQRTRLCNNPPPAADGKQCVGKASIVRKCEGSVSCAVNGQWSEWSDWSTCSVTCGQGQRRRLRSCDNPPAQFGGAPCNSTGVGHIEVTDCTNIIETCPVDGAWSEWSDYGPCETLDCNTERTMAHAFRHRSCNNPLPEHGGVMCEGSFHDSGICMEPTNCKRDGGWGDWTEWDCSEDMAKRIRACDNPPPINGGLPCSEDGAVEFFVKDADPMKFNSVCGNEDESEEALFYDDVKSTTVEDDYTIAD